MILTAWLTEDGVTRRAVIVLGDVVEGRHGAPTGPELGLVLLSLDVDGTARVGGFVVSASIRRSLRITLENARRVRTLCIHPKISADHLRERGKGVGLTAALAEGLGRSRSFGCGMLLLRPLG